MIIIVVHSHVDYIQRQHRRWDQRCTDVEAMLHHNLLAYTTQPIPHPGRVDLAAMFLFRDKIVSDNIDLGKVLCSISDDDDDRDNGFDNDCYKCLYLIIIIYRLP